MAASSACATGAPPSATTRPPTALVVIWAAAVDARTTDAAIAAMSLPVTVSSRLGKQSRASGEERFASRRQVTSRLAGSVTVVSRPRFDAATALDFGRGRQADVIDATGGIKKMSRKS